MRLILLYRLDRIQVITFTRLFGNFGTKLLKYGVNDTPSGFEKSLAAEPGNSV